MFRRTTGKALKVAVVQKISVMNYQGALAIRTNQLLNFKTFFWLQNNRFIVEILENANKIRKEKKLPLTPSSTQITPIMCIYTSFCFFLCVEPPLILIYKKWIFTFFHLNHEYLYQTHTFLYINIVRYSESCSVVPDSFWPHGYTVHGLLQARILEWVAVPFPRGSSQPRNRTQVSHIAGGLFTVWATGEAPI